MQYSNEDNYSLFVPIEDHDLIKSVEADENGDYIVQGVMTSDDTDEENDSITPEGMDCSYFLEKGWIKYEHGNSPNQFVGEPMEVKIGQFEHPTLHKSVNGIFIKGRLFAKRALAQEAVRTIQDLQKSHTKRTMGWSIEGNVKERDRKTGKIVKSILRNVVLTLNPVNTSTYAELAKSFAKNHELTIDMEKSMDIAATAAINTQDIEGYKPEEDSQGKWVKLFRDFVKQGFINKSLRSKIINGSPAEVGTMTYSYALDRGLDNEDAYEFASYISDKQLVLKSLFITNFGGGNMSRISSLLDADLEELQKSFNDEDDEGKEKKETENDEKNDNENDENDENDEDTEKSIKSDFAKSFAAEGNNAEAFEVSDFLASFADEIGYSMDGFAKSMAHVTKQQNTVSKALSTVCELIKGLAEQIEDLQTENTDLKKSLNDVLNMPIGRKSLLSGKEVATLQKSITEDKQQLNRYQIGEVLMKSFEAGEIPGTAISRFEAGVGIPSLGLPQVVLEKLGM